MSEHVVVADEEHNRFTVTVDGFVSELSYRKDGDRLTLHHTGVPQELRNQGIASQLVQAAVDRAQQTGETVVPSCPYVAAWLKRHPDEAAKIKVE